VDKKKDDLNSRKSIAENLTALLKKNNLNSNQLAQVLGIPMMTIRRLMSGETEDPRISTLKIIADFFNISIDHLVGEDSSIDLISSKNIKSYTVPKIGWSELNKFYSTDDYNWSEWQSISLNDSDNISKKTFALESRPSMYPRFPKGTIFIIDPQIQPTDGDIVLVKIKLNSEYTLRELFVDPPHWILAPLIIDSESINFDRKSHEIV
ncbi:TPA: LexA family transcriptional regulator, partial [Legionella pneumophila]|nr:LexA family transcriptional regulator [Legionella pneumophila]